MPEIKNESPQEIGEGRVFITYSRSRPEKFHVTILSESEDFLCTCEGYMYNGRCRHVTEIKEMLAEAEGDW
jgi:hypothetical protein